MRWLWQMRWNHEGTAFFVIVAVAIHFSKFICIGGILIFDGIYFKIDYQKHSANWFQAVVRESEKNIVRTKKPNINDK